LYFGTLSPKALASRDSSSRYGSNVIPPLAFSPTSVRSTIESLDRLERNTQHVLPVVDELTSRGVGFRSLTEGLHTEGPMGTAMLTIMAAAFAQLERDIMIERTRAGLAAAAANGRKGGRPRKVDDADAAKGRQLREKGIAARDIAKMLGVSRATVYRYLSDGAPIARAGGQDLDVDSAEPTPVSRWSTDVPRPRTCCRKAWWDRG
jgi:Resolvase, N terminal domain/Helix-turn-helix domain of resolvase